MEEIKKVERKKKEDEARREKIEQERQIDQEKRFNRAVIEMYIPTLAELEKKVCVFFNCFFKQFYHCYYLKIGRR